MHNHNGTAFKLNGTEGRPLIVCIHGLGLCQSLWDPYLDYWAADFQILTYDLPGHVKSAPSQQTASLTAYSDQILTLLDHLQIQRASLVGFSIGGMINRRFAMNHPDRLDKLVILNSPHDRGEDAQQAVEERAANVRADGPLATLDAALHRWFTADYLTTGAGVQHVRHWREQVDAESYAQAAWVLAHGVRELIKPDPPIHHPALIMTCENDSGSTPQMSFDIASEIANCETRIVDHLQHLGLMERPDLFAPIIAEFLQRG